MKQILFLLLLIALAALFQVNITGCAQIMTPTGGPRDTIPPKLIGAAPSERTINFNAKKITLNFDEYVQLDNVQQNLIVSPTPKALPVVDYKLKTITVKLRDTLLPNTTYSINFGNAIKDLNEGNPFRKYTYVFSTGSYIDSMEYDGKVIIAETGKIDSTLQVFLYKNAPDSAVETRRPDYISRLDTLGNFSFSYLPPGLYKVYAIKDGDGSKTYNSKSELFGFLDKTVNINPDVPSDTLYAYAEEKEKPKTPPVIGKVKPAKELKLKITTSVPPDNQDLLKPFKLELNTPLKTMDISKIKLSDTLYHNMQTDSIMLDSTGKIITIYNKWEEDTYYRIVIAKDAIADSLGTMLLKSDTIKFKSKKKAEYGTLLLHFKNLQLNQNPVLQFVFSNEVIKSYPLTSPDWSIDLITPNEYELRILYDTNKNGKWDPGNYHLKKQPERVISVNRRVTVHPNFDNEIDIAL